MMLSDDPTSPDSSDAEILTEAAPGRVESAPSAVTPEVVRGTWCPRVRIVWTTLGASAHERGSGAAPGRGRLVSFVGPLRP